jgi:hypothetical protein
MRKGGSSHGPEESGKTEESKAQSKTTGSLQAPWLFEKIEEDQTVGE